MGKVVHILERYVQWIALAAGGAYMVYMAYTYLGSEVKLGDPQLAAKIEGVLVPPGEVDQTIIAKAIVPLENAMKAAKDKIVSVDPATSTFMISRAGETDRTKEIKFKVTSFTTIASTRIDWVRVRALREQYSNKATRDKLTPADLAFLDKAKAATLHFDDLKQEALVTVEAGSGVETGSGAAIPALTVTLESPIVENVQGDYDKRLDEQKVDVSALALNTSGAYQPPGIVSAGPKLPSPPPGVVALPVPPPAMPPTAAANTFYTRWTVTMTGPPDAAGAPTRQDTPYFTGIFTINSAELTHEMESKYAAVPNRTPTMLDPQFTRVYLLREEKVNGKWSAPTIIESLPINKLEPYPPDAADGKPITTETWYKYMNWMQAPPNQALILDPKFYPEPPDVSATKWTRPGKPAAAQAGAGAGGPAAIPAQVPPVVNGGVAAPIVNKDREILVYDTTIREGKTYRYALRYRLFNPVFDHKQSQAQPANIHEIFDVRSYPDPTNEGEGKASEAEVEKLWTEEVTVEPTAKIFVTKANPVGKQTGNAQFTVFIWKNGHWSEFKTKPLTPGDPVNAPASAGRGSTGWTVVDVRQDPHVVNGGNAGDGAYVLIMDDHGTVMPRDAISDAANPDFAKLKGLVGNANAAALGPGAK